MFNRTPQKGKLTETQPTAATQSDLPCFEDMVALAKSNPAELESLRVRLCNELIDSAPEYLQKRLKGLQFTIDMERKRAKSSMAACIRISSMMNDSLSDLRQAFSNPKEYRRTHYQKSSEIITLFSG